MIISSLVPLLSFLAYSALIFSTLRHKPIRIAHTTFMLYLLGVALWASCAFLLYTDIFPHRVALLSQIMLIAALFTVIAYYHFLHTFMNKPSGIRVFLGYAGIFALIPLIAQDRISYVINSSTMLSSSPNINYTLISISLVALGCVVLVGSAIVSLLLKFRHSTDPMERNKITYLLVGFIMMALFGLTKLHPTLTEYPLAHFGNLANALCITYAIIKYQLLDITIIVRRGLGYAITALCCIALYLALLLGLLRPLDLQLNHTVLIASAGVTILIAILFYPTRATIQEWIERLVYRETYDYRRLLLTFTDKMSHVLDLNELAEYMLTLITKGIHAKEARLLLPDNGNGDFLPRFTIPAQGNHSRRMKLTKDNPIVTWLAQESRPFSREQMDVIPQMKSLWEKERQELKDSGIELFFPIKSKGNLIGILAVSKKQHHSDYRSEDLDMVSTMTSQAGVVIENAQLYAAAKLRANTDELTGLFNHRYFHERIEEEISRGLRFGVIFSLLFLDLDLFKRYNDIHGHLAGDDVLRQVGATLKHSLRTVDTAFRYGGDEFAVISPGTSPADASKVAERIRRDIEKEMDSKEMPVTCSVGVASWPADGVMREALIQCADSALYHAKRWGNRTCLASEVTPTDVTKPESGSTVKQGMLSTIYALAATVDARDHYTYGHS
ncbi:diguanylate cyclase, partial [Chloroflexota bacterium]